MFMVRDLVLDRDLYRVASGDTVAQVARRMADVHVGAILVLSGDRLEGIFSERDLMKRVVLEHLDPETTPVGAVMTTDVVSVDELASLDEAMELMQTNSCRHLPVMRGSLVAGFLSMRDLMKFELARKTEELHHMRAYIHGA